MFFRPRVFCAVYQNVRDPQEMNASHDISGTGEKRQLQSDGGK